VSQSKVQLKILKNQSTLRYRVPVTLSGGQHGTDVIWFISSAASTCTVGTFFFSNHGEGLQMLIQKISNTGFNHILPLTRRKQIIQQSDRAKLGSTSSVDDEYNGWNTLQLLKSCNITFAIYYNCLNHLLSCPSVCVHLPIRVAMRSKAWICGQSLARTAGSNTTGDTDVCLK